ncbi:MAG: hypothetical protein AAGG68_28105 [Bacteroidota bacterium]
MKELLFCALISTITFGLSAQSIGVNFQQESVSWPFTRFDQWNPGAEIEYGFPAWEKGNGLRQVNLTLGYYFHRDVESAFYLKAEYNITLRIADDFHLDIVPALGYMHSFYPGEIYRLTSDGNYELKQQLGRPHLWLESGLGFSFFRTKQISPFLQYRFALETPFANGIPVFPHSFYQAGVQYKID